MSRTELQRVVVLEKVLDGRMTIQEAAVVLELSPRQVKRLKLDFDPSVLENP